LRPNAEMAAAYLCGITGIEHRTIDNSAAYITRSYARSATTASSLSMPPLKRNMLRLHPRPKDLTSAAAKDSEKQRPVGGAAVFIYVVPIAG